MSDVAELAQRTERLQSQVDAVRMELAQLRRDLERLQPCAPEGVDCLTIALSLAQDLGPEFSAEDPDRLVGRGDLTMVRGA